MVVHEGVKLIAHLLQTAHGVGDLKIVMVVVTGIQSLVKLIVGNGMKYLRIYPTGILTVDHLAHEPEIRFHGGGLCPHFLHEVKIQDIGTV